MIVALSAQRRVVGNPSPAQSTSRVTVSPIWAPNPSSAMQKVRTGTKTQEQEHGLYMFVFFYQTRLSVTKEHREVIIYSFIPLNAVQLNKVVSHFLNR